MFYVFDMESSPWGTWYAFSIRTENLSSNCAHFLLFLFLAFLVHCEQILYYMFSSSDFLMKWNRQIFYYKVILHFWGTLLQRRVRCSFNTPGGWPASVWFHVLLPSTSEQHFLHYPCQLKLYGLTERTGQRCVLSYASLCMTWELYMSHYYLKWFPLNHLDLVPIWG